MTYLKNHYNLSTRQIEVFYFILAGKSSKQIADKLKLSPRTVERHVDLIKEKTKSYRKSEIITKAIEANLVVIRLPGK